MNSPSSLACANDLPFFCVFWKNREKTTCQVVNSASPNSPNGIISPKTGTSFGFVNTRKITNRLQSPMVLMTSDRFMLPYIKTRLGKSCLSVSKHGPKGDKSAQYI